MLTLTSSHRTWAHGISAGWKLGFLASLTILLFLQGPGWSAIMFASGVLTAGAFTACTMGLLRSWARLLAALWPFALLILIWHAVTGTPLAGALILMRMAAAVGAANLLTMTTPLSEMQAVFLWLARPLTPLVAPKTVALAMALVVRFLPVMLERERQLRDAWTARSHKRPGWRLMVPMTLAALDDAERVADALRARGGVS